MTDRRNFFKTLTCAACFFGLNSFLRLDAQENKSELASQTNRDEAFALHWITELLESIEKVDLNESQLRSIIKNACKAHLDLLDVPKMVNPYIGNPDDFLDFLKDSWSWVVTNNQRDRKLIIDENKPFCVCPLLKNSTGKLYPALCYCSEGFAEKMFSLVYQYPVEVTVNASVQRGDPSCVYVVKY